ncbi:MAG: hypothetical protein WC782_06945 [Methylococcaceae bacterium]|jgi:hypothetical protein
MNSKTTVKSFRIAFSFAGEKRDFVAETAQILAQRFGEEKILYDSFHEEKFALFNLGIYLPKLYGEQSDLIVPVFCANYDQKRWTGWEWVHIYGLLTKADGHRVMLSRFDFVLPDGLSPAAGFIELDNKTPQQFATLILQRLADNEGRSKDYYLLENIDSTQKDQTSATEDPDTSSESTGNTDELHKKLAFDLLEKSQPYLSELKAQMKCSDAAEIINRFSTSPPQTVASLFVSSRKALNTVRFTDLKEADKHEVFEAVTALYLLAAMRLVNTTSKQNGHIIFVPRNEQIVCAIIATALFGGSIKIVPDYSYPLPQPEYVFEVIASAAGDYVTESFERAMYASIFQNNRKVDISALDSQGLNQEEYSDLVARLQSIREIDEQNLCLVVTAGISPDSAVPVTNKYQIPTLFQSDDTANVLLGMTHSQLTAQIKEFWLQLNKLRNEHIPKPTNPGVQQMQGDQFIINATQVNLATAKGEKAIASVGDGQSNTGNQQTGLQISDLINLHMIEAINALPSEESRKALKSYLATAQQEIKKPKPDKNLIEKSLALVKEVGDGIEGGEKIVELCSKALPLLSILSSIF